MDVYFLVLLVCFFKILEEAEESTFEWVFVYCIACGKKSYWRVLKNYHAIKKQRTRISAVCAHCNQRLIIKVYSDIPDCRLIIQVETKYII